MKERTLKVLEFHKIRRQLAEYAQSEPGKEKCLSLVPSVYAAEISQGQRETDEGYRAVMKKSRPPLFGIRDQGDSFIRLRKSAVLSTRALLYLGDLLRGVDGMKSYFTEEDEGYPLLMGLIQTLVPLRGLRDEIFRVIVSEEEISDDASPTLQRIRKSIRKKEGEVKDKLNQFLRSPDSQKKLQENLITMRDGRYVLPVRADARSSFPGIIHDQSASKQTLYIEPMSIVTLNNEVRELEIQEQEEIEKILRELSSLCANYVDEIEMNQQTMTLLDFIFAKGRYALELNATMPKVDPSLPILLTEARHPLLDPNTVVPITVLLGDGYTTLVITGPNTGGKTVTLKTVGLLVLMAQSGLHIPVKEGATLPLFDEVFSDIGDEQSIEQSLSTFSSHMVNIVSILNEMTPRSLVLFDELGAGTDPTEGAALAIAILETLLQQNIYTIATTHYSQLKLFALNTEGVRNASVEFDVKTLKPTYRLQIGLPGKSNAFEISRRLGLSDAIIDHAKQQISDENLEFEDVLTKIETESKEAMAVRQQWQQKMDEVEDLQRKAERRLEQAEERKEKAKEEGFLEAQKIIEEARIQAQMIIEMLEKEKGTNHQKAAARAKQALRDEERKLQPKGKGIQKKTTSEIPKELTLGETVRVLTMDADGQVLTLPDKNNQLSVQVGILKMNVGLDEIEKVETQQTQSGGTSMKRMLRERQNEAVSNRLDLRGDRLDEAIGKVDQLIDSAVLSNMKSLEIIHGKGTGSLRSGISEYLKKHPMVKSYRLGSLKEGGDGVTIVEL